MADPVTNNYGLVLPTVGGDVGTWGGIVNSNLTTFLDGLLGNVLGVAMTNVNVTLTLSQWQNNGVFRITGALAGNLLLILPLSPNSVGSATAIGGRFVVDNQTTGSFSITVVTAATGSTGVVVPQGARTSLFSDTVNVLYADDSRNARIRVFAGNPNGVVSGSAGNASNLSPADMIWDTTDQSLFVSVGGVSWASVGQNLPQPGGYLTPTSGLPIIGTDVVGVSTIFYIPYRGPFCPIYNGSSYVVFGFAQLPLVLSGAQVANNIYDVFAFVNAGAMQVGFGPSWLAGAVAGSVTPGLCARGQGAGSTQLNRINGILVNNNIMNLNNGASLFNNIPAFQATYLGSIAVDTTNSQVSCYRSYGGGGGVARKWGIWNYFNRVPIKMNGGSATASWLYNANAFRQSNADAGNAIMAFCGFDEEEVDATFDQTVLANNSNAIVKMGIGLNSTTSPTQFFGQIANAGVGATYSLHASLVLPPFVGLNQLNTLESGQGGAGSITFFGTSANMLHVVRYNG